MRLRRSRTWLLRALKLPATDTHQEGLALGEAHQRTITIIALEVRGDGGMERAAMETIEAMLDQGWTVYLVARVCEMKSHPGLHWIRVKTARRPFTIAFPLFVLGAGLQVTLRTPRQSTVVALGAIVPNRVDIITVQFCQAAFAKQAIKRASQDSALYRLNARISRALALGLERWCYRPRRLRRMTAVSELVEQELRTYYDLKSVPIDVIPNGVDIDRFAPNELTRTRERARLGLASDELAALFVGGDWRRKGLQVAIEAAAEADWTLIVVGGGDVKAWQEVAAAAGARVHFCGHLPSPENIFCAADAFILPSNYEGFALVTIEAAATGLPLLVTEATGAGALAERAGVHALPPQAAAFASELRRLAENPILRNEVGVRARAAAEKLAWPNVVSNYMRVYSS